jgi:ComF family protein
MVIHIKQLILTPLKGLADLLLPPTCPVCDALLDSAETRICPDCAAEFEPVTPPLCPHCGQPLATDEICAECRMHPPPYTRLRAVYAFAGAAQEAVLRLKFGGKPKLADLIADRLMTANDTKILLASADWLIPVPLHPARLRERGFNQAALIAKKLSRGVQKPLDLSHLRRIRATSAQALTQSRLERLKNIQRAFRVSPRHPFRDKNLCLIDDVVTTGATLRTCAQALLDAGAQQVTAVTFARSLIE